MEIWALLHGLPRERTPALPNVRKIFTLSGMPGAVNVLRQWMPTAASVFRVSGFCDERAGPMIVSQGKIAVSQSERR